jgi:hypothetical protein
MLISGAFQAYAVFYPCEMGMGRPSHESLLLLSSMRICHGLKMSHGTNQINTLSWSIMLPFVLDVPILDFIGNGCSASEQALILAQSKIGKIKGEPN